MITKISENLYLGNKEDVTKVNLDKYGINTVLNVASEVTTRQIEGINNIKLGFRDHVTDIKNATPAINALKDLLKNKENVILVHCRMGISRTPHVVASALSELNGNNYHEVYKELQSIRPIIIPYSLQREREDLNWPSSKKEN